LTVNYCGDFKTSYTETTALLQTPKVKLWTLLLVIGAYSIPFFLSAYTISLGIFIAVACIGAVGINLLIGLTGQISVGHAAFMGIGAYSSAIIYGKLGMPYLFSLISAGFIAAACGMVVGIPSVRLKGFYLAIATLAFQFIVEFVLTVWRSVTGGPDGLATTPPSILGYSFKSELSYYFLCVTVLILGVLVFLNIRRSKYGRIFTAIRDRDIAASALGVNIFRYKLLAFAISSFYAGISGSLFGHYVLLITPEQFNIWLSIEYVAMIIIGGLGTVKGAILGAVFIGLLPEIIKALSVPLLAIFPHIGENLIFLREGVFGIVVIVFLIFEPEGLAKVWVRTKNFFKLWPYSY
jgi:branched-chain amino acid transport system permease protein